MPDYTLVSATTGRTYQVTTAEKATEQDIDNIISDLDAKYQSQDTGQSRFLSGLSNVGRGALSVIPGAVGGVGYLTEPVIGPGLKELGEDIESGIEKVLPVNPAYEEEFSQKAAGAIGQAGGMLFTGGIAGALGKGAAAARGLGAAEAAAAGTQLAGKTLLGSGFLSGSREGGQAAERYGMEGVSAYTRALLGGAIEGATEKYLFGLGTELAPVKKFLGDTLEKGVGGIAKMGATEAGEEAVAQAGGNIATKFLAPEGVETPGIGSGVGEAAALGGVAGLALGGVTGLLPSGEKTEPATAAESVTVESGEMPLPTVLKNLDEKVTAAVEANADVLPATAAALKDLESGLTDAGEVEGDARQGLPIRRGIATPGQEGVADLGAPEGDVLSLVPKKSPAAPPAEPTDATEGQPPTPGGVGAPPVVTNEPQTPSPAEQPVPAAQTPVATEPEATLPETEKVVAPKVEPDQGAGMTQRDTSKPEEMSPEEKAALYITKLKGVEYKGDGIVFVPEKMMTPKRRKEIKRGGNLIEVKAWADVTGNPSDRGYAIIDRRARRAFRNNLPVDVSAVDAHKIKLPEGYVRQGDLYVFAPEAPAAPAPKVEPEQGAGMTQRDTSKEEKLSDQQRYDAIKLKKPSERTDEEIAFANAYSKNQKRLVEEAKASVSPQSRQDFITGDSPTKAGKRLSSLATKKYFGESKTPEEVGSKIEDLINAGWRTAVSSRGERVLTDGKNALGTKQLGAVGIEYANFLDSFRKGTLDSRVANKQPVSAEAVDAYGITLPEGYVRQGDLYVFAPEAPPTQTETQPKPEDASKNQVEETGGTPPVESQPPQTRPEGEAQEGASQRGREGEEGVLTPEAPFTPDDKLLLRSPFMDADEEVTYRGPLNDRQSVVVSAKGVQYPVDTSWLRRPGVAYKKASGTSTVLAPVEKAPEPVKSTPVAELPKTKKALAERLAGKEPSDFSLKQQWKKRVGEYMKRSKSDLEELLSDRIAQEQKEAVRAQKIKEWTDYLQATLPETDTKWRSSLASVAEQNGVPDWTAMMDNKKGEEVYRLASRLADRGASTPTKAPAAPEFGSTNTIFTKEKAEEASKIIKRKLGQTNVPAFDPELFAAATNYAGFLIEGGVRKFGDFSAEMVSRFGESIRPFIKGVYNGVRDIYAMEGMDDAATVSKVLAGETPAAAPAPAPAAEAPLPQTQQTPVARPSGEPFAAPTEESRAAAPGQLATARSVIDEERKRLGRPPVEKPIMEAISDEAIYAQAKAEYDKDPEVGNRLVDSLNARPRAVDSLQQAILGQELVRRRNALDIASDAYIADPKNTQLEDDFNKASARYEEAKFAAQYGISDVGRTLRLARVLLNLDFSREGLITRFRQASGGVNPNAEQLKKIDELSKTILESEKKVEELRATKEENARLQELLDNMVQDMKDQAIREFNSVEKARKEAKAAFKAAPNKVSALDTLEEKIRARRAERKKKVMADPFLLNALADAIDDVMLGAIKIAKGVRNVAKWMSEMKAENPDYTDEQLQEIRKASENFYENEIKPELGAEAPAAEVVEEETLEDEEGEEGKVFVTFDDVTGRDIYRMVKDRVQKGMTEIGEVMKSVTEEIQKQLPDVTERQVRDRFSGYGKPLFPSQEASAKKVRELRTLAQYASKIEDAQKKIAPLRSGRQRDDATDAIRQAQKELYRLMKENGLEMPPGPRSLKGPLDVIKRRLKNRRDDLQRQMTAGKRDVVSTKKVERDAEAKALEEEIRALDEALDALDPPLPPSYQDKVKDRMRAVDKEIVELRRKIKERDVSKQKPDPIITEQLQVKLNERDALKQALDDLRIEIEGEPQLTQEEINERAERVLDRNIDALEAEIERLKDPNYFPQEAQKAEATPTIIRLRKQQEILREERKKLSEARFGKKVKSESERVDIAIAALEKSIDNINQKILTGDLSPTARKGTPLENAKIKNLRAERNSLRSVMNLMRKAKADAAKDPVAEQIRRDRKYLQSRIEYYENIQKKMADGTYKPKVKEQRKYDESLGKELQKLEDAKMAVADMLLQERLKNRSTLRKAFDFIGDLFGIQRVLTATADISAIGNQGNFILFSNPKIAFKAIPDMLRAMKTPEGEKAVQERIRNMPEYKDGELNRVGLYLSMDAGPNSPLSKMEEQYATRLVNKWPKAFGGGIVRGSERAYKTFLDVIRVAAYKSMKETLVKGGWFTPPQEATQERLEALSNLVNNATGRGAFKMKKADQLLSQAAPFLNTFIFAPRFGLSRIAMALGLPLWRAAPGTRALIAQEYAKYAIGVTVASLLLSLAQDDEDEPIVPDPRSTDFLKTRFGDYRVDLLGGFQQPFVFLTRMLTGETVTRKGNVRALRESDRPLDLLRERPLKLKPNYGSADASSVLGDFLRFKLAPTSASILNALNSKDPVGNRTDVTSEILKAPVPLVVGQLVESLSAEDPADAALLSILGLTGIRTSYQGKDADKNKTEWEKMVKKVEELTGIK